MMLRLFTTRTGSVHAWVSLWPHALCVHIRALHMPCAGGFVMRGTFSSQTTFYPCGGYAAKHPIPYALCGAWRSTGVNGPPYSTVRLANPVP
jgi:hypothetical protein